jgi:hypothetical protein
VSVFPFNIIPAKQLENFVRNLSGDHDIQDHIYVSLRKETPASELAISLPLVNKCLEQLISLEFLFSKMAAIMAPISVPALHDLAQLTSNETDIAFLNGPIDLWFKVYRRRIVSRGNQFACQEESTGKGVCVLLSGARTGEGIHFRQATG